MAKGKYRQWLEPEGLELVTNWAAKGCTNREMARNMGVHPSTLCDWANKHPEFSDALKKGRAMCAVSLENTAFRLAMGMCEEEVVFKVREPGGGEHVEKATRRPLPNVAMLIFLLKNRCGYRDNPPADTDAEVMAKLDAVLASIEDASA